MAFVAANDPYVWEKTWPPIERPPTKPLPKEEVTELAEDQDEEKQPEVTSIVVPSEEHIDEAKPSASPAPHVEISTTVSAASLPFARAGSPKWQKYWVIPHDISTYDNIIIKSKQQRKSFETIQANLRRALQQEVPIPTIIERYHTLKRLYEVLEGKDRIYKKDYELLVMIEKQVRDQMEAEKGEALDPSSDMEKWGRVSLALRDAGTRRYSPETLKEKFEELVKPYDGASGQG
ncbi:hypothetical protein KEM55_008093, partial [Ascosphaera atra]